MHNDQNIETNIDNPTNTWVDNETTGVTEENNKIKTSSEYFKADTSLPRLCNKPRLDYKHTASYSIFMLDENKLGFSEI